MDKREKLLKLIAKLAIVAGLIFGSAALISWLTHWAVGPLLVAMMWGSNIENRKDGLGDEEDD